MSQPIYLAVIAMSQPIKQVFEEYIKQEYPLVPPEGEYLHKIRKNFYTGAWVALGIFQRSEKLPDSQAVKFLNDMNSEIRAVVYEKEKPRIITGGLN